MAAKLKNRPVVVNRTEKGTGHSFRARDREFVAQILNLPYRRIEALSQNRRYRQLALTKAGRFLQSCAMPCSFVPALLSVAMTVCQAASAAPPIVTCVETDSTSGFSRAVAVRPCALTHTAQFLALTETGEILGKDRADLQTERVLDRLAAALAQANTGLEHVVKLNVCARDAETVTAVNRVLRQRLRGPVKPAVTFVTGRLAHPEAVVAIDAIAVTEFASRSVALLRDDKLPGAAGSHVAVLPKGRHVYIAGQAEPGTLVEATRKTMASLQATLKFLGLDLAQVGSVKSFIAPMSGVPDARAEIVKHFGGEHVPPLVFVEWAMANPIEIEMVVAAGESAGEGTIPIEYLTPPGMTASPIYSRVVRVNRGDLIYVGNLYGPAGTSGEAQVRDIFAQLMVLVEKGGSDLRHLAKATYYVSDNDSSTMLNKVRPEFYDPQRPPAASKAMVAGVGFAGRSIALDMIAVRR
ncbi:MAG: RidA family protein [Verrucomicrobia bacterium]|nr:RidA family protein [Verrucomicrobiota bacterium]